MRLYESTRLLIQLFEKPALFVFFEQTVSSRRWRDAFMMWSLGLLLQKNESRVDSRHLRSIFHSTFSIKKVLCQGRKLLAQMKSS